MPSKPRLQAASDLERSVTCDQPVAAGWYGTTVLGAERFGRFTLVACVRADGVPPGWDRLAAGFRAKLQQWGQGQVASVAWVTSHRVVGSRGCAPHGLCRVAGALRWAGALGS